MAGGLRIDDQAVARIGDQRRAGVADQRHRLALGERRQQLRPLLGGVVVVIGDELGADAESGGEARR